MLQNEIAVRIHNAIKKYDNTEFEFGVIDTVHQATHEGKMHTISYTKSAVADTGTLIVRIKANAKDVHVRMAWTSEGKSTLKTYIGTTYNANGTTYIPFNRRTSLSNSLSCNVYIDPTINVLGTLRGNDFVGAGGATPVRVGGTGAADVETIIDAGTELLIVITNARGSASDLNFIGNIYER